MIDPASNGTLFLPPAASTLAPDVDNLYYFIYYLCVISFVGIVAATIFFVMKYRHREGGPKAVPISHNTLLEITWSVVPLIILIGIFAWGFRGYLYGAVAPRGAMEIQVHAKRWIWEFEYPDGNKDLSELHVPVHKPVKLIMTSMDDPAGNVIHSFFVPAFRTKADVLPNRYTTIWFEATQTGTFQVFCTEYCGTGHSDMLAKVVVMEQGDYQKWLDERNKPPTDPKTGQPVPLAEVGKGLFAKFACVTCHKSPQNESAIIGPSLIGAFGRNEALSDGTSVIIDENYIRESIQRPTAKVVKGFQPVMPPFEGTLKDWQINALIEYIKTLK